MIWKINRIGNDRTTVFAVNELAQYLGKMDASIEIQMVDGEPHSEDACIIVGCDPCFDSLLPEVEDRKQDDAIHIDVKNAAGIITGTNPRSVLIAVYRYLKELGCKFIRPGKDNEVIPQCDPARIPVSVTEAASYRHREVCIEGAVSYEHVSDMIDWIPKVAMNGYFMQFVKPYGFFRVWYSHEANTYMPDESKSDEELAVIVAKLEDEIAQRGILYSSVGHSWSCECLGVDGSYWKKEPSPSDEVRKYLAMCNGERDWYGGVPINTNLCYSNPEVQEIMTDYMVKYTVFVEVISDHGEVVASRNVGVLEFDFEITVKSDTARYFYLKLYSRIGEATWSSPVWTGREFDKLPKVKFNKPALNDKDFKAKAWSGGKNAGGILSADIKDYVQLNDPDGEIIIDMGKMRRLSAIGYYANMPERRKRETTACFMSRYEYSVSNDCLNFTKVASGRILLYGNEHIAEFEPIEARYVKIRSVSTVGTESRIEEFKNIGVAMGAIRFY